MSDEIVQNDEMLQDLAKKVAIAFPDLEGRAIAVTDADITKDNVPEKLPMAMLALGIEQANDLWQSNGRVVLTQSFVIEFWFKPIKYRDKDGKEIPFWAYYRYEEIRDKALTFLKQTRSIHDGRFEYVSLQMEALEFAVVVTLAVKHHHVWCDPSDDEKAGDVNDNTFKFTFCQGTGAKQCLS